MLEPGEGTHSGGGRHGLGGRVGRGKQKMTSCSGEGFCGRSWDRGRGVTLLVLPGGLRARQADDAQGRMEQEGLRADVSGERKAVAARGRTRTAGSFWGSRGVASVRSELAVGARVRGGAEVVCAAGGTRPGAEDVRGEKGAGARVGRF